MQKTSCHVDIKNYSHMIALNMRELITFWGNNK